MKLVQLLVSMSVSKLRDQGSVLGWQIVTACRGWLRFKIVKRQVGLGGIKLKG